MALSERTKTAVANADIPTTTKDMTALMEWEHGDVLYGTQAKDQKDMKAYREDINKAWGQESRYKDFYVDTFKSVSEQLKAK